MSDVYIKIQASGGGATPVGATLMKTGQTTSYRTGDDGDLEAGRATDFFTLASNNPFGNTNRFTDEIGTQTYADDIVIDWSTYNGTTVLGWYIGDALTARVWNDAVDICLTYSIGTYTSGWKLPNSAEYFSIMNYSTSSLLNYPPFNYALGLISSTTAGVSSILFVPQNQGTGQPANKNASYRHFASRTFTVTGTTLT